MAASRTAPTKTPPTKTGQTRSGATSPARACLDFNGGREDDRARIRGPAFSLPRTVNTVAAVNWLAAHCAQAGAGRNPPVSKAVRHNGTARQCAKGSTRYSLWGAPAPGRTFALIRRRRCYCSAKWQGARWFPLAAELERYASSASRRFYRAP